MGGIVCLIIYNFFIFIFLKDKNYLFYCFFSLSFMLPILVIHGYMDKIFQPIYFSFSHYLICFSSLALMTATVFTYYFLEIRKLLPHLVPIYKLVFILSFLIFLIGLTPLEDLTPYIFGNLIDFLLITANIMFITNSIQLVRISNTAKFYLISWVVVLCSLISWFGMTFGIFPNNTFTQHSLLYANMGQMLTLSLALAYRILELTKQKQAAEERAIQKEKYQRLVMVLSHDIANSLMVINAYSKRLIKQKATDPVTQRSSEKIYFASENIKQILNNVREEELFHQRKTALETQVVSVLETINLAKSIFEEHLLHKNIEVTVDIQKNHFIKVNETCFLNNIVNNILSNSIKFSYRDSKIEISTSMLADKISIRFRDYGKGIGPKLVEEIFFSNSIVSTEGTSGESGHGFGATLIREYVELFNGSLAVNSWTVDCPSNLHGTEIIISFPVAEPVSETID